MVNDKIAYNVYSKQAAIQNVRERRKKVKAENWKLPFSKYETQIEVNRSKAQF